MTKYPMTKEEAATSKMPNDERRGQEAQTTPQARAVRRVCAPRVSSLGLLSAVSLVIGRFVIRHSGMSTPIHRSVTFQNTQVAVADAALRAELAARFPEMWRRLEARRAFMRDELGLRLSEDVLPLSNFPAAVMPYFLASERCLARANPGA